MLHRARGHHAFSHGDLAGLAYDWERVGDPDVPPCWPFKVYLPRSTDDVVRAVREVRAAGERLVVRGSGHSSNGLVTADGGAVLLTERLGDVVGLDERRLTCTMQAGARLAEVDVQLARRGLGLKVVGDHADLTAGGFASVGGISPASHRFGMFVDTVTELEYVDWDGDVHRCGRGDDVFPRVLAGLGRHGVITELTVELQRVQKQQTVLRNDRRVTSHVAEFVDRAAEVVRAPGEAWYASGMWVDLGSAGFGQVSVYRETSQRADKTLRSNAVARYQRLLGAATTALPPAAGAVVKYLGVASLLFPPAYTTAARVERSTDDLVDASVGDPTRMLIVFAPAERFEPVVHELLDVCADVRRDTGAIGAVVLYVKPIRSAYLSGGQEGVRHAELILYLGVDPARMTPEVLAKLVDRVDDVAIAHGAFRYLHTRSSAEPERRRLLDPNARYLEEGVQPWSA
jgi:hypothetical protein